MVKSRVLWAIWLLFTVCFCIMTGGTAGYLLIAVSVVLPLLAGLLTRLAASGLKAELTAESYSEKGAAASGQVIVTNTSFLPADRLLCRVSCENLLTGEAENTTLRMAAPGKMRAATEIEIKSRHSGRVRLTLRQLTLFDPFGLFRFRIRLGREISALTMFAPRTFSVETQIAYGENANLDSDEYSMKKAGYDPSETFAVREYQPGDRIRQIHWKLTEKFDSLMVRDYGLPIQNTILLLLETGRIKGTEKTDPSCLDALAEAILSVSQELISQQIVHTIGWQNHEENTFSSMEIETDEDLNIVLPGLLGAVPGEDEMSAAEHYLKTREQLEFAHVVLFTPQHRSALSFLADQCLLTEVLCEEGGAGYDRQDGISMIGTGPETMTEYLSYIEI